MEREHPYYILMDTPWLEASVTVLKLLIPNNHTKFGQGISNVCGVLEEGKF
jgi:hypothetical protein